MVASPTHDAATPLINALSVWLQIPQARLLIADVDGHQSLILSACAFKADARFLDVRHRHRQPPYVPIDSLLISEDPPAIAKRDDAAARRGEDASADRRGAQWSRHGDGTGRKVGSNDSGERASADRVSARAGCAYRRSCLASGRRETPIMVTLPRVPGDMPELDRVAGCEVVRSEKSIGVSRAGRSELALLDGFGGSHGSCAILIPRKCSFPSSFYKLESLSPSSAAARSCTRSNAA
jgi:hypothetical protein